MPYRCKAAFQEPWSDICPDWIVPIIISEAVSILQLMMMPVLCRYFSAVSAVSRNTGSGEKRQPEAMDATLFGIAPISKTFGIVGLFFPFRPEIRIPPFNFFLAGLVLYYQDQSSAEMVQVDDSCGAWMLQSISYNPSFWPSRKNILRKTKQPDSVACRQIVISEHTLPGQIAMLHHCRGLRILVRCCGPSRSA